MSQWRRVRDGKELIAGRPWKDALFGDVGGRRGPAPVHPLGMPVNLSKQLDELSESFEGVFGKLLES